MAFFVYIAKFTDHKKNSVAMKKMLLTTTSVLFGVCLFGQHVSTNIPESPIAPKTNRVAQERSVLTHTSQRGAGGGGSIAALGDTLYTETFSNGLAGENGAWTNNGTPAAAQWEYRGLATTPNANTGSRGAFAGGGAPLTSPTQSNGFVIFDSDYLDNGGTTLPNGSPNTANGSANTPHIGELISPVIDLSSNNAVLLTFNTYWRRFTGDGWVVFSTDGGTTWPDSVQVFHEDIYAQNFAGDLDESFIVYASQYIGGAANARFKFYFDGADSHGNPNGSGYYFWQVDDINVLEAPDNDLVTEEIFFHTSADTGFNRYYTNIPINHALLDTVQFGIWMGNRGSTTQPNARMEANITTPLSAVVTRSSAGAPLASLVRDSVAATQGYTFDAGKGDYDIAFTAVSDSTEDIPTNNVLTAGVSVTDTVYARDEDNHQGFGRWYGSGQNYEVGVMYTIRETDTVTSASITFQGTTAPGSIVSINVYDASLSTPIVSNAFISLSAADIGNWVTFDLTDTELTPGDYIVAYEVFSDSVLWAVDEEDLPADPLTVFVDPDNSGTWFFSTGGSVPLIRMNVKGASCPVIAGTSNVTSQSTCGNADGSATVTPQGGSGPYTISWPDGTTGPSNNGLASGTINVTVTDANFCDGVVQVVMTDQGAPVVNNTNTTDVLCFGDNTGSITLSVSGGTPPLNYNWSNGGPNASTLNNIVAGTYTVTITDANNCTTIGGATITQPASALSVTATNNGVNAATATGAGGTGPYTYAWSNGNENATGPNPTGLPSGSAWTVTVTDINGCESTDTISVISNVQNIEFAKNISIYPNPNNGAFQLQFNDMSGAYTVSITSLVGQEVHQRSVQVAGGTRVINFNNVNLRQGIYMLTVRDEFNQAAVYKIVVD